VLLTATASVVSSASRFVNYAFLGGALVVVATTPNRATVPWIVPLSAAFAAFWIGTNDQSTRSLLGDPGLVGAMLGFGALAAVALLGRAPPLTVLGAVGIPAFTLVQGWLLALVAGGLPLTYDAVLLAFDRSLGFDPAYALGRLFVESPWLAGACGLLYAALPVQVALLYAAALRGKAPHADPVRLLITSAAVQLLGALVYRLVPAVGPRYVFAGFPDDVPDVQPLLVTVALEYPRNAMPSVHLALALVLLRASRGGGWVSLLSVLWCLAIGLATLGMGEHYLVDLVVAVPFAFGIEAACARRGGWRPAVAAVVTALWIGVVRSRAVPSQLAAWAAVIGTVAIGSMLAFGSRSAPEAAITPHRRLRERLLGGVGLR
jgi:hypothetical protein